MAFYIYIIFLVIVVCFYSRTKKLIFTVNDIQMINVINKYIYNNKTSFIIRTNTFFLGDIDTNFMKYVMRIGKRHTIIKKSFKVTNIFNPILGKKYKFYDKICNISGYIVWNKYVNEYNTFQTKRRNSHVGGQIAIIYPTFIVEDCDFKNYYKQMSNNIKTKNELCDELCEYTVYSNCEYGDFETEVKYNKVKYDHSDNTKMVYKYLKMIIFNDSHGLLKRNLLLYGLESSQYVYKIASKFKYSIAVLDSLVIRNGADGLKSLHNDGDIDFKIYLVGNIDLLVNKYGVNSKQYIILLNWIDVVKYDYKKMMILKTNDINNLGTKCPELLERFILVST
jgi:hypothetical protein